MTSRVLDLVLLGAGVAVQFWPSHICLELEAFSQGGQRAMDDKEVAHQIESFG